MKWSLLEPPAPFPLSITTTNLHVPKGSRTSRDCRVPQLAQCVCVSVCDTWLQVRPLPHVLVVNVTLMEAEPWRSKVTSCLFSQQQQ